MADRFLPAYAAGPVRRPLPIGDPVGEPGASGEAAGAGAAGDFTRKVSAKDCQRAALVAARTARSGILARGKAKPQDGAGVRRELPDGAAGRPMEQ